MWQFLAVLAVPFARFLMVLIDKSSISAQNKAKLNANFKAAIDFMQRDRSLSANMRDDIQSQNNDLDGKH